MKSALKKLKDVFPSIVHIFHFSINHSIVTTEAFDVINIFFLCFPIIFLICSDHNILNHSTYFKLEETEAFKGEKIFLKTDIKYSCYPQNLPFYYAIPSFFIWLQIIAPSPFYMRLTGWNHRISGLERYLNENTAQCLYFTNEETKIQSWIYYQSHTHKW